MKLLIAGTPEFKDKYYIGQHVTKLIKHAIDKKEPITFISHMFSGVSEFAANYAVEKGYDYKEYAPDWEKYGKRAGIVNNQKMASVCTHAVVFWDGISEETKYLIDTLKETGVNYVMYKVPLAKGDKNGKSKEKNTSITEGKVE